MTRQYTPEEKRAALIRLAENHGNITMTAHQMGIAERTLRFWQRRQRIEGTLLPTTPLAMRQLEELPPFANDLEAVNFMRRQMLDDLVEISRQLRQDFAYATPYQRMVIIPKLLDRLMKMDQLLKPYTPKEPTTYHIVGSEGEEPNGDEPELGRYDFLIMDWDEPYDEAHSGHGLHNIVDSFRRANKEPTVVIQYWRPTGDEGDYKMQWSGKVILDEILSED